MGARKVERNTDLPSGFLLIRLIVLIFIHSLNSIDLTKGLEIRRRPLTQLNFYKIGKFFTDSAKLS